MAKVAQVYPSEQLTTDEFKENLKYSSGSIEYVVTDASAEHEAIVAVRGAVGTTYKGMRLTSISVSERLDDTSWRIRVDYSKGSGSDGGEEEGDRPPSSSSFDFSTTTRTLKQSVRTLGRFATQEITARGGSAPSYGGLINVKNSGGKQEVEGVEVVSPQFEFSETHHFFPRELTTAYKKTLAGMVGCINSKAFRGYEAGEVLFMGVSGSREGEHRDDTWALSFKFAVKLTERNVVFHGTPVGDKPGWAYAWFTDFDAREMQSAGQRRRRKPAYLYIEQVYYADDFKKLGIGV